MRSIPLLIALMALASPGAFADCAADIEASEAAIAKATDAQKKAEAEKHIAEARSHLAMKHEDVCKQHVAMANDALK